MELPVRMVDATSPPLHAIKVDGSFPGPGLELSHWPGNQTPRALGHELSTGIALEFARLDQARRLRMAAGANVIANNHFDTDGVCALFAVRWPARALQLSRELLGAAAAGDFFEVDQDRSYQVDCLVAAAAKPESGLIAPAAGANSSLERYQLALDFSLELLPAWLTGDLSAWREIWEEPLARLSRDRLQVERAQRTDIVHLDWSVWRAAPSLAAQSEPAPGRHALHSASACDRLLWIAPAREGTRYRLLFSTRSWFDFQPRPFSARPDLERLCARLNELEGSTQAAQYAWRSQEPDSPAPELWFGTKQQASYAEHNLGLAPSRLEAALVRREISEALRLGALQAVERS